MNIPVTDLEKGDHIVLYPPSMTVNRTYRRKRVFNDGTDFIVEFNTGSLTFYEPGDEVEVDNREGE